MTAAFSGGFNTYVPQFDASGQLVVEFSRNPKDFTLNRYVTISPVKKSSGYYLKITAEQAARILNSDLTNYIWHDGNDAPSGKWGLESFEFAPYETKRYAFPFQIGYRAVEQADWQILASHAAIHAQQAMTARTHNVVTQLTTAGNYAAAHTATATASGGGLWSAGTTANPIIRKSLNHAARIINKSTLGKVKKKDLKLVISPDVAVEMAASAEIHEYLAQSPFAQAQIRGDVEALNSEWDLPNMLYSVEICVEDAVKVTSKKGATKASDYAMGGNVAALVARPGGLTSESGGPNFSSMHIMSLEEMTVESRDDPDNRRHNGRVVDEYDAEFVSPASAFLFTAVLS